MVSPSGATPENQKKSEDALQQSSVPDESKVQKPLQSEALPEIDDEPLPDWEELTPELMEDECLRGDTMLRWTVILLAFLLGWTFITETPVLVSIRTGEAILDRGGLPPRTDIFSSSAEGRSWGNLNWLSDVVVGGIHRFLGMGALSVLCSLIAGATFFRLAKISVPTVSTWWASVCAALGVLAAFPFFQPGAMTFSLMMMAVLLLLLSRWTFESDKPVAEQREFWSLPVLFLFWANMDERAWIGLVVLIVFAIGVALTSRLRKQSVKPSHAMAVGAALLTGILATPWPGQSAVAFLSQYRASIEAVKYLEVSDLFTRLYYGLASPSFWASIDLFTIAFLMLVGFSLITQILNVKRLHWGWLFAWGAVNGLTLVFGQAIGLAALVNVVVATLNGQDWYRHRFSMEFSIDNWSVLYARAGRALTVLAMFALAYMGINGALMGANGRRIGTGLDPRWRDRIASLETAILPNQSGEKVFPVLPRLGDLLIWSGKKPFVDSRYSLYVSGDSNLFDDYRKIRDSMFAEAEEGTVPHWKEVLPEAQVNDVMTRLWGEAPPYASTFQLLLSPDWVMTGMGSVGANFTRNDPNDESLSKFTEEHMATRFADFAFRPEKKYRPTDLPATFPMAVSWYDRWLIQKADLVPESAQMALHEETLFLRLENVMAPQQMLALCYLAIRNCRRAIEENPNHPLAYRILMNAYNKLGQIEQQISAMGGRNFRSGVRDKQILGAAMNAARASGNQPADVLNLFHLLIAHQKLDVALQTWNLLPLENQQSLLRVDSPESVQEGQTTLADIIQQLEEHVSNVRSQVDEARARQAEKNQLLAMALQGSSPLLALSILEEDLTLVAREPSLQILHANLLFDVGRLQESWERIEGMASMMAAGQPAAQANPLLTQWRISAAQINLAGNDVQRATQLWEEDQSILLKTAVTALLQQPFSSSIPAGQQDLWGALTGRSTLGAIYDIPERWALLQLDRGLAVLETGRVEEATGILEAILKQHPEFSGRTLVAFYLTAITDKFIEPLPPSEWIPVWSDMFAPDEISPPADDQPMSEGESQPEMPAEPASVETQTEESASETSPVEQSPSAMEEPMSEPDEPVSVENSN